MSLEWIRSAVYPAVQWVRALVAIILYGLEAYGSIHKGLLSCIYGFRKVDDIVVHAVTTSQRHNSSICANSTRR